MTTLDKIKKLGKALYPTGRAFKIPFGGVFDKLNSALSESEQRAFDDAVSILDSALPDNDNFTTGDATDWERRLGLITNPAVPLSDRKLAIIRKIRHPGNIPARQNFLYLQGQLQDAGFNVFVFENRFPTYPDGFETKTAFDVASLAGTDVAVHGGIEHGEMEHGQIGEQGITLIANFIDEDKDANFDTGATLRSTFFVGANPIGTFADVLKAREDEFRQLILKIKPVSSIGFLFINFN